MSVTSHPTLPKPVCSFHRMYGQRVIAVAEGMTTEGVPAFMCDNCVQEFAIGLTPDVLVRFEDIEGLLE